MPIYACVDNLTLIDVDPANEIPTQTELEIGGQSYRRLDPVFMAWIEQCVSNVVRDPKSDNDYAGELCVFWIDCIASGVKPCDSRAIPTGYRKPDIAQQLGWLKGLEWDQ